MDFDFTETYKDYSNTELLKIAQQPGNYVPEAVAAAKALLAGRDVSEAETLAVQEYIAEKEARDAIPKKQLTAKEVSGFWAWLFNPESTMPAKWFSYFFAGAILYYAWVAYVNLRYYLYMYDRWEQLLNLGTGFTALYLLFIAAILYLLYNKERWGWIFLFVDMVFSVVAILGSMVAMFDFYHFDITYPAALLRLVVPLLLKVAMTIFVWSPAVSNFFEVPIKHKWRVLWVGIGLGICFKVALLA